jgi:CheY-like chemotaxis protein
MIVSNKSILLVEDNRQDETLILRSLKKIHMANHVDVVRDGQQALDYLFAESEFSHRDVSEQPVVVLLDINLPRLSGIDVLVRLRSDPRTMLLPVVMLTSSDVEQDLVRSYRQGCNGFVRKPIEFGAFAETIAQLGIYWCAINRPPPAEKIKNG